MDEQRQPGGSGQAQDGMGDAGQTPWPINGAAAPPDRPWSGVAAALPPSFQPLSASGSHRAALDDDTPPSGVPAVEPPLWREASRHAPSSGPGYGAQLAEYTGYTPPVAGGWSPPSPDRTPPADPAVAPEPAPPASAELPPAEPARWDDDPAEPEILPKRVPSAPELPRGVEEADPGAVPASGTGVGGGERWTAPELARIADSLRRHDVPRTASPVEGFDVDEVLAAVREVTGVRDASLRANPSGVHTLRLDLSDDADPVRVSRVVARMLSERMGLSTAPQPAATGAAGSVADHPPAHRAADHPPVPRAAGEIRSPRRSHSAPPPTSPPPPAVAEPPGLRPAPAPVSGPPLGSDPGPAADIPVPASAPDPTSAGEDDLPMSRPLPAPQPAVRVVIDHVQVSSFGMDATVEVRLAADGRCALGLASGPAVDGYVTRLAAVSAAKAIDELLREMEPAGNSGRCFVEHTGVVPFGTTEIAVVVVQLVCEGWVEQLAGCAVVAGDPRQAMVRATLGAVNRRLEALLS